MEKIEECQLQIHIKGKEIKCILLMGVEVSKEEFNIPVENLAIWRGDGIFEAIAIHKGYLFGIDKHIERFAQSAEKNVFQQY